ncbi:hypothetical protein D3C84_707060 [compost metagenome]
MRILVLVQRVGAAIGDRQSRLDFLRIGHEQALAGVVHQGGGKPGLGGNHVIALEQARQELAQRAVAQAQVERPGAWVANRIGGAGFELIAQGLGELAGFPGLKPRRAHLLGRRQAQDDRNDHQQQPERFPAVLDATARWFFRCWRFIHRFSLDHGFTRISLF